MLALAAALLCAVCLTACGDDDDSDSTAATAPSGESGSGTGPGIDPDSSANPANASDGGGDTPGDAQSGDQAEKQDDSPKECRPTRIATSPVAAKSPPKARPSRNTVAKEDYTSMGDEAGPSGGIPSLRIKPSAGGGFILYHGADGNDYWVAVNFERGEWKLIAISPANFGELQ